MWGWGWAGCFCGCVALGPPASHLIRQVPVGLERATPRHWWTYSHLSRAGECQYSSFVPLLCLPPSPPFPPALSPPQLHAERVGISKDKLDAARVSLSRDTPMWQTLDACLQQVGGRGGRGQDGAKEARGGRNERENGWVRDVTLPMSQPVCLSLGYLEDFGALQRAATAHT